MLHVLIVIYVLFRQLLFINITRYIVGFKNVNHEPTVVFRGLRKFSYLPNLRDSANNCVSFVTSAAPGDAFLCCCHE